MSEVLLLIAGLFLPLFPLSMVFNTVFDRLRAGIWRVLLLLVWPQIGIAIAYSAGIEIPTWVIVWALLTAMLYGFRALTLREVGLWTSFLATSAWALLWLTIDPNQELSRFVSYALGFSAPLALLILLCGELEKRFGAAYTGLYGGLALSLPRLSGVLVMVVLAITATPFFPGFATMLAAIFNSSADSFMVAFVAALVWLIWSWAGARLLQGLIVGPAHEEPTADLSLTVTWSYAVILGLLVICGIYSIGCLS